MRIGLDLHACQTRSANRGIGRYSLSFAKALLASHGQHDFWTTVNGTQKESLAQISKELEGLLPHHRIKLNFLDWNPWAALSPDSAETAAQATGLAHIYSGLNADVLHISSLLDWEISFPPPARFGARVTSVTLYDLIPLLFEEHYLNPVWEQKIVYFQKLEALRHYDVVLAISACARRDAIKHLGLPPDQVVDIGAAIDPGFRKMEVSEAELLHLSTTYDIRRPFLLYTTNDDFRKNNDRTVDAFARLPRELIASHSLILVSSSIRTVERERLLALAVQRGLSADDFKILGAVSDADLVLLYNACRGFVFPSLYEGFGLPALEAMSCGAPTIASDTSSLPDILGRRDALFDPQSADSIAQRMHTLLTDAPFRTDLSRWALERAKEYSWARCAKAALAAWDEAVCRKAERNASVGPMPDERLHVAVVTHMSAQVRDELLSNVLPDLQRHWQVDLYDEHAGKDPQNSFSVLGSETLSDRAERYDAVIYVLNNQPGDRFILDLAMRIPGIVFFHAPGIGRILAPVAGAPTLDSELVVAVLQTHGPHAASQALSHPDQARAFGCFRAALAGALGIIVNGPNGRAAIEEAFPEGIPVAAEVFDPSVIESFRASVSRLVHHGQAQSPAPLLSSLKAAHGEELFEHVSSAISLNAPDLRRPRLYMDVWLYAHQLRQGYLTGIQRVVAGLLHAASEADRESIWPVYEADDGRVPRVCLTNQEGLLEFTTHEASLQFGDIYVLPELRDKIFRHDALPRELDRWGVRKYAILYDLLPVRLPEGSFPAHLVEEYRRYLGSLMRDFDGIACISRAVADDLIRFVRQSVWPEKRTKPLHVGYFPLGAPPAIDKSAICNDDAILSFFRSHAPVILMVGTIEPRKRCAQALEAMEALWAKGVDAKLCIVGRVGWNVDALAARIRSHDEFGRRLLHLPALPDAQLAYCYEHAAGLLNASIGEGFGLPLVEAAQYSIPLLTRDLPIFREVCGESATYFTGDSAASLAEALERFVTAIEQSETPVSRAIPTIGWRESLDRFMKVIDGDWYATVQSANEVVFHRETRP